MPSMLDALLESQAALTGQFAGLAQQTQQLSQQQVKDSEEFGRLQEQQKAQELQDAQRANEVGQILATSLGANPNAPNFRLTQLGQEKTQASQEAQQLTSRYQELQSTSFLDNPILYIFNQFEADSVAQQANAANLRADNATMEMASINDQVQAGIKTAQAVTKNLSAERMANELKVSAMANTLAVDKLKLEGIKANSDAFKAVAEGNRSLMSAIEHQESIIQRRQEMAQAEAHFQFNKEMAIKHYNLEVDKFNEVKAQHDISNDFTEQRLGLAQASQDHKFEEDANNRILQLEKAAREAEKAGNKVKAQELRSQLGGIKKQLEIDKAIAERDAGQKLVSSYKQAAEVLGIAGQLAIPDDPKLLEKHLQAGLKSKEADGHLWRLLNNNVTSAIEQQKAQPQNKPIYTFGFRPVDAVQTLEIAKSNLSPERAKFASDVRKNVDVAAQAAMKDDKNIPIEKLKYIANSAVSNRYAAEFSNPEKSEFAKLPKLSEIGVGEAFSTKVRNHPIFQKYFVPAIAEHNIDSSFENVSGFIKKALEDKVVNFNQAVEFGTQLYKESIAYNNAKWGYVSMGIAPQRSYPVLGISDRELNLTDPTDFRTALITQTLATNKLLSFGLFPNLAKDAIKKQVLKYNPEEATK